MTDWDLMLPGIGLTSLGAAGVALSLSGIAATFLEGMHAVSLLAMFIGLIFLAQGLFKDGFPTGPKAKSASLITLGFLVTFGFAAAITISSHVPSIYAYITLMTIIFLPISILAFASYKKTPYMRNLTIVLVGIAIVGGSTFYALGVIVPKSSAQTGQNSTSSSTNIKNSPTIVANFSKGTPVLKVVILPGASAKANPNFDPKVIQIKKGGGILWTNNDNVPHTVTSFADNGKSFDSSLILPKKTFGLDTAHLAKQRYNYFCSIHPFMRGTINII
jgi:plastocyanin